MRIAEYKQVSTRTEHRVIKHDATYDDAGNITAEAWSETTEVEVPVMGLVYRDATPEEISEIERQQTNIPVLTAAELREQAYNTDPVISLGGAMLTVTEAAQQWAYYAAEGNTEKMDALTALIAAAKADIRAQWPDE